MSIQKRTSACGRRSAFRLTLGSLIAVTACASVTAFAGPPPSPSPVPKDAPGRGYPMRIVAYVANSGSGTASSFDVRIERPVTTTAVGNGPTGVGAAPDGSHVYVANGLSDTVSFIETTGHKVVATVPVGSYPFSASPTRDGSRVLAANWGSDNVSVIDTASRKVVATPAVGELPHSVATLPDGTAYVTNSGTNNVTLLSKTHTPVVHIPVGDFPSGIIATPRGVRVYVANRVPAASPSSTPPPAR
ncbi:YncE family protein OS=Streptomyces alboniger OX=132473 GN=CP975_15875 PE=4 SV=1 [Streptomyces alboniger]